MRIKVTLVLALLLVFPVAGAAEEVITFDATIYRNDTVQTSDIRIMNGSVKPLIPEGSYAVRLLAGNGSTIYEDAFHLSFTTVYFRSDGGSGSSHVQREAEQRRFQLPALPEAEQLRIVRGETTIFETDLDDHLCGSESTCFQYCRYDDRWREVRACEKGDKIDDKTETVNRPLRAIAGILIAMLAIVILAWPRLRKRLDV
jgi:hypothetical protein